MRKGFAIAVAFTVVASVVQGQTITSGFTFSVANGGNCPSNGTHFHSSTGGVFGNPAGKGEVGNFSSECVRGLSEYNLTGLTASPSAFVTFNVFKLGGLFNGTNDFPFNGLIDIFAYAGNNTEDISDYQATSIGSVGAFNTTGLVVGNTISFDITSIFNAAILAGRSSLGIRLQREVESSTNSGAITFDTFRLTSNNQSSVTSTPEPSTFVLLATGVGAVAFFRRRRTARRVQPMATA